MYEEAWSVKHKIVVQSLKKHEISNATDGIKDAVFVKSESLTNNNSNDEWGNSDEDVRGFYDKYKLHTALSFG
jgi:hypothetical protein